MGTLFSTLSIGRAGLRVAQVQLDVAGHNIANVNRVGFSRQRADVKTYIADVRSYGSLGRGPRIDGVDRVRDRFLDISFRDTVAGFGSTNTQATFFTRVEDIFLEPTDTGFNNRLNDFFDAMGDFATNVESIPGRIALLSQGEAVAASLREIDGRLREIRTNANEDIKTQVTQINSLGLRIAEVNEAVRRAEAGGRQANDLRDERDLLLDELAQIVNITARERDSGMVDVLIGSDQFVNGDTFREIETYFDPSVDPERPDLVSVRYVDDLEPVTLSDGILAGLLKVRDVDVAALEQRMDELAGTLIREINALHADGNGLTNFDETRTGTVDVSDPNATLDTLDLPFDVQSGSFSIVVYDAAGAPIQNVAFSVNPATATLNALVISINSVAGLSASVGPTGRLNITPDAGNTYTFRNDTSDLLNALGMNTFFTGSTAGDIGINQDLQDRPEWISSGTSDLTSDSGDNTIALAMSALRDVEVLGNDTQTLNEYYESTIVELGVGVRANLDLLEVEAAFVDDFERRRQEVSGVNLDEEVSMLIQYQRAFEASARIITVTDRMLGTLLNLVQ